MIGDVRLRDALQSATICYL